MVTARRLRVLLGGLSDSRPLVNRPHSPYETRDAVKGANAHRCGIALVCAVGGCIN